MLSSTQDFPPIVGVSELAALLGKTPATIFADRCRAPHKIPPACTPPGGKSPRWITADVIAWLRGYQEAPAQAPAKPARARRVGRPTKAEALRRKAASAQQGGAA